MAKIKIYSQYDAPGKVGEVFTEPSLTDQLANEPLDRIFKRFIMSGELPPLVDGDVAVGANDDELESVLADTAVGDVSQLSKLEQQDILCDAARLAEQLKKESAVSASETKKMAPTAEKSQSEPSTGEKKENA